MCTKAYTHKPQPPQKAFKHPNLLSLFSSILMRRRRSPHKSGFGGVEDKEVQKDCPYTTRPPPPSVPSMLSMGVEV